MIDILKERSTNCELCGSQNQLEAFLISPKTELTAENSALLCSQCIELIQNDQFNDNHWFCLNDSAWTQEAPVQVLVFRLLSKIPEDWARELLDQIYIEDSVKDWALIGQNESQAKVIDSNGTELKEGDTVSLIKSLDVKGAGFTAKQGTIVRNIKLGDDPTHIEGKVNGTSIFLKTEFLKKN